MSNRERVSENIHRLSDTCNVYLVQDGRRGVLIDFGAGRALDQVDELGTTEISRVLVTHHHRDQVQGLQRAADAGIEIWVPPVEQALIHHIDAHWQARAIENNYDVREDRFSLLGSVPITGTVSEYLPMRIGRRSFTPIPTPGHTIGSVSYLATIDGQRVAFTGDLIYAPGKIWSLAATMWSYAELPGVASTILSLLALRAERPDPLTST